MGRLRAAASKPTARHVSATSRVVLTVVSRGREVGGGSHGECDGPAPADDSILDSSLITCTRHCLVFFLCVFGTTSSFSISVVEGRIVESMFLCFQFRPHPVLICVCLIHKLRKPRSTRLPLDSA